MISSFLNEHLPKCTCPKPRCTTKKQVRAALHQFSGMLEQKGILIPNKPSPLTPIDIIISDYATYMNDVCGLSNATIQYRSRYAREFLYDHFGQGAVTLSHISTAAILKSLSKRARHLKPGSVNVMATSLRSFLRYMKLQGESDDKTIAIITGVPDWKYAALPTILNDDEIKSIRASFDVSSPVGLRDKAIVFCQSDLALRASEVRRLTLDDIDWRQSTVTVAAGKNRRADLLPLPSAVSRSLAEYIRKARPPVSHRYIFVQHRAPVGQPLSVYGVHNVTRRVLSRCGIDACPYSLRHTAATKMLCNGASLKEIADVLRHRSIDTTSIYAKVDIKSLRAVALPWPEVEA